MHRHLFVGAVIVEAAQQGVEGRTGDGVLGLQVPPAGRGRLPAESHRPTRQPHLAAPAIHHQQLPLGVLLGRVRRNVARPEKPTLEIPAVLIGFEHHEEGEVAVLLDVVAEIRDRSLDVALPQQHVNA